MQRYLTFDIKFSKKDWALLILIFIISIPQFIYFVIQNSGVNYHDEIRYIQISNDILTKGLFNIADNLRTYLYPFLISILFIFTDGQSSNVKILFSLFQYLIYIITVFKIAKMSYSYSNYKVVYFTILTLGLINPYLIQSTTLFLTDILATSLLIISLIYLLTSDLNKAYNGMIVAGLLYGSVLIRPSSAVFMIIFFVIAFYRLIKIKDFKPLKFIIVGLLLLIMFFPQLYMNYTKFNHFTPLIHLNLFEQQSIWATQYLKYATVVIEGEQPGLYYFSPTGIESNISIFNMITKDFGGFILVFFSHIFGLLDWGYIDSYIRNLSPSEKIFPSVLLYVVWFIIVIGTLSVYKNKKYDLVSFGLLFASFSYAMFIGLTAVESRFGYPIYLMLLFYAGIGIRYLIEKRNKKAFLIKLAVLLLLVICISLYFSYFIDMQTGRIFWF